jgi:hypothetical protein
MKKAKLITCSLTALLIGSLAGCATAPYTLTPVGGSRADGTVVLVANRIGRARRLVVDREASDQLAVERCQAWGFSSAERFGGAELECTFENEDSNCMQDNHRFTYQCLD